MEYTIKITHPCEREIQVRVDKDLIDIARDEYFDELNQEVIIPGYRKGKAPREVLQSQFAEKAKEAVIKKLISIALRKISEAEKIKMIAYPEVRDLKYSDEELKFKINVELDPEISLADYKGIKAQRVPFEIKDEEMSEVIEKIRETFASFIPVAREARMNDYLIADYEVELPGKPKEEHKDEWIFLHEHNSLGDFSQKLLGVRAGEERNFEVLLAQEHSNQELRGKQARFFVRVKDVKEKSLPKADDELAKLAGEYKDLEALKQAVRDDLKRKKEMDEEVRVEQEILQTLVENTPFELSRGIVERHLEKMVHHAIERLIQKGYAKGEAEKQHDALAKEMRAEAERQIRLGFILDRIAEKENIRVSAEDFNERLGQLAQQYRLTLEKVKEHFQKEESVEGLVEQIIHEKVFKFIKENAQITNAETR